MDKVSREVRSSEELALGFVDKALHGGMLGLLVTLLLLLSAQLLSLLLYLERYWRLCLGGFWEGEFVQGWVDIIILVPLQDGKVFAEIV